jgi:hypothetical protein
MFGISDPGVWITYVICIAALAASCIYGYLYWNKDCDDDGSEY